MKIIIYNINILITWHRETKLVRIVLHQAILQCTLTTATWTKQNNWSDFYALVNNKIKQQIISVKIVALQCYLSHTVIFHFSMVQCKNIIFFITAHGTVEGSYGDFSFFFQCNFLEATPPFFGLFVPWPPSFHITQPQAKYLPPLLNHHPNLKNPDD